jgi:hypothetical protein
MLQSRAYVHKNSLSRLLETESFPNTSGHLLSMNWSFSFDHYQSDARSFENSKIQKVTAKRNRQSAFLILNGVRRRVRMIGAVFQHLLSPRSLLFQFREILIIRRKFNPGANCFVLGIFNGSEELRLLTPELDQLGGHPGKIRRDSLWLR